ncbi:unnamed protein product, partial [marine sediment metagenome]
ISSFKTDSLREYELRHLNTIEEFTKPFDKILLFVTKKLGFLQRENIFYKEKKRFKFDPNVLKLKGNIYLNGSWQSEKYFKDIRETIIKEFTVKTKPNKANTAILEKIKNVNSVAIHIRRKDYLTNPKTKKYHGFCSLQYYQKAIQEIRNRINSPRFFIFSDDISWAKENLEVKNAVYVDNNPPGKGYEDIRLMKNCKHFITANSSFSWWGAWLSENKEKIVLVPKKWLNINIQTPDL